MSAESAEDDYPAALLFMCSLQIIGKPDLSGRYLGLQCDQQLSQIGLIATYLIDILVLLNVINMK